MATPASPLVRRKGTLNLRAYPSAPGPDVPRELMTTELFAATLNARSEDRRRFGRAISMDVIEAALRNAYRGSMRNIADILRETIETDPHLGSILNKRFGSVANLPWDVQPASGTGIDRDKAMFYAEVIRQQIRNMKTFRKNLSQLAWALFDGRSCLELQWVELERGLGASDPTFGTTSLAVQEMDWIHPRRITFGSQRELRIQPENIVFAGDFSDTGIDVRSIPDKFIWWTPQLFGEYPEREGLGIRCMYWSFFKRFAARERMILSELYGKPWRIITIDEESNAGDAELKAAEEIVDALGSSYTARMPRGTKLEVIAPGRSAGQVHQDIITESDKQNSKLVLGQTGTTDAVPAGLNSNQANVMQDEQLGVLIHDATQLSEVIEKFLTDRIIAVNFGPNEVTHAPTFKLRADLPADRVAELTRLEAALNSGLAIARDEAYELSGFSIPDPDEVTIQLQQPPTPENSPVAPAIRPMVVYPVGGSPDAGEQQPPAREAGAEVSTLGEGSSAGAASAESTVTVNEDRASRGLEPLTLPDGSLDPRGDLTIKEFDQTFETTPAPTVPTDEPVEVLPDDEVDGLEEEEDDEIVVEPPAPSFGLSRLEDTFQLDRGEGVFIPEEIAEGEILYGEAGIHAHKLIRALEVTATDGAHSHVFKLPNGVFVQTELDGIHQHRLPNVDAETTLEDGEHQHAIIMGGAVAFTGSGASAHQHQLQVEATAVDGVHRHILEIPDPDNPGKTKTIMSMTAGEFAAAMREGTLPVMIDQQIPGATLPRHKKKTVYGATTVVLKISKLPNGKYRVTKEDGTGNLGTFDTLKEAQERLGQVEGFKERASANVNHAFNIALDVTGNYEFSVELAVASDQHCAERKEWSDWVAAGDSIESVTLALEQDQPETPNGSVEDFVVKGMRELTRATSKWADTFQKAVEGETSTVGIFAALQKAELSAPVDAFGRALERRKMQALMLGVLDDVREIAGDESAGATTIEQVGERGEELGTTAGNIEEQTSDQLDQLDAESGQILSVLHAQTVRLQTEPGDFTRMPFQRAVTFFKGLNVLDRASFERASAAIKRRAFTVAGVMKAQMLRTLQNELVKSIQEGADLRQFSSRIRPRLQESGFLAQVGTLRTGGQALNAGHVETVFRTNVLNTYNTGRYVHQNSPAVKAAFPVWEFRALPPTNPDDRQTHFATNGKMLMANDPFWQRAYPPYGFNCRCRVVARDKNSISRVVPGTSIQGLPDPGFTSGRPALALG